MAIFDKMNSEKTQGMFKKSNLKKMHFWVTLLDHAISKTIRQGYFEKLCNDQSLFQAPCDRFYQSKILHYLTLTLDYVDDPNFEYEHVKLIMCGNKAKAQMWENADIELKMIYWDCLQQNYDVIQNQDTSGTIQESNEELSESEEFSAHLNIGKEIASTILL